MTGANRGIACRPGKKIHGRAALAAAFMAAALLPGASRIAEAKVAAAQRGEAAQTRDSGTDAVNETVRAQARWLPLREALRLLRREPRAVMLLAHKRNSGYVEEFRRKLEVLGYRVDTALAADGPVPIEELLRAVRGFTRVPAAVVILEGSAETAAATEMHQYALALDEVILSLAARGARLHSILLVVAPEAGGAARDYHECMLRTARERGALVADLDGTSSPAAAADVMARAFLAAAAPHPSLFMLLLYPVCSLALLWLWRRSRF